MIEVRFKRLKDNADMPFRGSEQSAGYDLRACLTEPVVIPPHETRMIGTGLAFEIPSNVFGAIFARSGMASKQGLRPANCVGVCDPDYRGEYLVALHNDSDIEQVIEHAQRIAQLVFIPFEEARLLEDHFLNTTDRNQGGFGSTGKF